MRDAPASTPTLPKGSTLLKGAAALRALLLATLAERDSALAERQAVAAERDAAITERDALLARTERLHHLLLKLKRMQFGAKSEQLNNEQLQFGFEDLEAAVAESEARGEKCDPELRRDKVAKRRASRGALSAHLPRIEVTLSPEDMASLRWPSISFAVGTFASSARAAGRRWW